MNAIILLILSQPGWQLPSVRAHEILASAGIEPSKPASLGGGTTYFYELKGKCLVSFTVYLKQEVLSRTELKATVEIKRSNVARNSTLGAARPSIPVGLHQFGQISYSHTNELDGSRRVDTLSAAIHSFRVMVSPVRIGAKFDQKPVQFDRKLVFAAVDSASRWLMSDLTDQKMQAKSWKNMAGRVTVHGDQSVSLQAWTKARGHKLTVNLGEARAFVEGKGVELLIPLACPEVKLNGKWIPVPDITTAHGDDFQLPVNVIEAIEGK